MKSFAGQQISLLRARRHAGRRATALDIENTLATLRAAGLQVDDVEMRKADLEDVFIDIMNRSGKTPEATSV